VNSARSFHTATASLPGRNRIKSRLASSASRHVLLRRETKHFRYAVMTLREMTAYSWYSFGLSSPRSRLLFRGERIIEPGDNGTTVRTQQSVLRKTGLWGKPLRQVPMKPKKRRNTGIVIPFRARRPDGFFTDKTLTVAKTRQATPKYRRRLASLYSVLMNCREIFFYAGDFRVIPAVFYAAFTVFR
jgi:hypothetical protein